MIDYFQLETALAADALMHLEKAIRSMQIVENPPEPPALCLKNSKSEYEDSAWSVGYELREALRKVTTINKLNQTEILV